MSIVELIAFWFVITALALLTMEGFASYLLSIRQRRIVLWATGRKRSTHDPDIGWVNKANTHIPDMYGPGRYLRINSQGFRSNHDFARIVPEGRLRIVCSGDSFTFAEGVDNDHTWCQVLASLDPRFETLNMGQTGYGIDQAYLWYKRDGLKFSHQVHLLSFTTDDFYRMQTAFFAGYAKPVLHVENGRLVVTNVPVPRRSYYLTWLSRQVRNLNQLRTVELLTKAFGRVRPLSVHETGRVEADKKTREVLRKIFEDLKSLNEEQSIQPVLVYLPALPDLMGKSSSQEWAGFLNSELNAIGIPLFNVVDDFRRLPAHEVIRMYIPMGQPGPDHFNDEANAFVATVIYEKLRSHPLTAERLFPLERNLSSGVDRAHPVT